MQNSPLRKLGQVSILLSGLLLAGFVQAKNVTPAEFWQITTDEKAVIIDVRTDAEFQAGHLPSAIHIPFDVIDNISQLALDSDQPIMLYCRSGRRAHIAEQRLTALGYKSIYNGLSYEALMMQKPAAQSNSN